MYDGWCSKIKYKGKINGVDIECKEKPRLIYPQRSRSRKKPHTELQKSTEKRHGMRRMYGERATFQKVCVRETAVVEGDELN